MGNSNSKRENRLVCLIGLVLTASTLACYWPVFHFGYVNLDDPLYVYQNAFVRRGFSWRGLVWAFQSVKGGNWNPLVWLSHMADCQVFGSAAGGHHLTNILLHAANALILFLVLRQMSGAVWRSALAAAIFAWHPLHVESVAWISERKDVLSALFWLLTLWAYAHYSARTRTPGARCAFYYGLALLFFVLGLMSKPILVTLPLVMLLLDYWPLQRAESFAKRLVEKIPFALLSLAGAALATWAQRKAEAVGPQALPLRLENAAVSYVIYLAKFFWPVRLAVFYPYPDSIPLWRAIGAVLVLGAITGAVVWRMKRRRYLATGWFWFLVTLLPVIGLLQVGMQAMADRYTYIPYIGLGLTLSWGLADLVQRWSRARSLVVAATAGALGCFAAVTWVQVQYWRDSTTLFTHALAVTTGNYVARDNLGNVYLEAGNVSEAITEFQEVIRLAPRVGIPYNDLGKAYELQGKNEEAFLMFSNAVRLAPSLGPARRNLGYSLILRGEVTEGLAEMERGVHQSPDDVEAQRRFADVLFELGKGAEALPYCEAVVRAEPHDAHAHFILGAARLAQKQFTEAAASFAEAVRLAPDNPQCLNALAWIYATSPQPGLRNGPEAVGLALRACEITKRQNTAELDTLAAAYAQAGRFEEAIKTAQEMLAVADSSHDAKAEEMARRRLELYGSGKSCCDPQ